MNDSVFRLLKIPAGSLVAEEVITLSEVEEVPAIKERSPSPPGKGRLNQVIGLNAQN